MRSSTESMALFAELLALLEKGSLEVAVEKWRRNRHENSDCTKNCPYGNPQKISRCAACLEGKLRTLSLRAHSGNHHDCPYRRGANTIKGLLEKEKDKSERNAFTGALPWNLGVQV